MSSPTEQHLSAAFHDLVAEQPFTPDVSAIDQRARQARRRHRVTRGGIGVGVVAVAAVAAVGVANAIPSAPAAKPQASGTHVTKNGTPSRSTPPLVQLAADLAAQPQPTGDATLVERETGAPGQTVNVWDLYTDDGRYFFAKTEAGLPEQVKKNNDLGDGQFGKEVAAATYAVHGDLDTALLRMAWPDPTPIPAWLVAQLKTRSVPPGADGPQIDNYVWEDCEAALTAGAGNPQVRAGVLRLVAALPDITVTQGTVDGQPTLTLAAGAAELGHTGFDPTNPKADAGPAYQEAITINADTGIPLHIAGGPAGQATIVEAYVVTRVNLADIAAGKF
ncbi:MAG TPA: hypothetical protein VH333_23995 [Pseudonocardiaceae bacterium]|jgi:hypothetical protein|nr:hypothetical protein [Pseudonocardiaceae bacterium]